MSVKSSLNVSRLLSTLDWEKLGRCLHITLTYWENWPRSKREIQRVKQALSMWLKRNVDCGVWRLEFHEETDKRGFEGERVPHWHVLAFIGNRNVGQFTAKCRRWWGRRKRDGNEHAEAVKFSDGDGRASYYLSMHAGKRNQAPPFAVGRWWGIVHRPVLLGAQRIHAFGPLVDREFVWWARLYRRSTGCRIRQQGHLAFGFSWFLRESSQLQAGAWVSAQCADEIRVRHKGKNPY